ncbi:MAG: hypothetical protein AAGJ74_14865 [Pseudomonadota bacterium]
MIACDVFIVAGASAAPFVIAKAALRAAAGAEGNIVTKLADWDVAPRER